MIFTGLAIWLGIIANRIQIQRQAAWIIHRHGGELEYDWQHQRLGPAASPWLRRWVGDEYFLRPVGVRLHGYHDGSSVATEAEIEAILRLRGLRRVFMARQPISPTAFKRLASLPELETLRLYVMDISNERLVQLAEMDLERLDLIGSRVSQPAAYRFSELAPDCSFSVADERSIDYAREWLSHFDHDGDGKLTEAEWLTMPIARLRIHPAEADFDADGFIDIIECANWTARLRTPGIAGSP